MSDRDKKTVAPMMIDLVIKDGKERDPADIIESRGRQVYCPGMKKFLDAFLLAWHHLQTLRVKPKSTLCINAVDGILKTIDERPKWNACPSPKTLSRIVVSYLQIGGIQRISRGASKRLIELLEQ
jgi:hypothetical protein